MPDPTVDNTMPAAKSLAVAGRRGAWRSRLALIGGALVLGIAVFALRLPGLSEAFCDPDQGTPAYTARLLMDGRCVYADAVISKPPGSVVLYAALFSVFGERILVVQTAAAFFTWLTALLIFRIGRRAGGPVAGVLSATLYTLVQVDMPSAGICANFTTWTILPTAAALDLLSDRGRTGMARRTFAAGFLSALAVFMKQTALPEAAVLAVVAWVAVVDEDGCVSRRAWTDLARFAAGGLVCAALFLGIMAATSCVGPMVAELNPLAMKRYLSSYDPAARWRALEAMSDRLLRSSPTMVFSVLAAAVATLLGLRVLIRQNRPAALGAWLCLAGALVSIHAGGHYYGHYFVVLFPFAVLVVGSAFGAFTRFLPHWITCAAAALLIVPAAVDTLPEARLAWWSARGLVSGEGVLNRTVFSEHFHYRVEPGGHNQVVGRLEWQPTYRMLGDELKRRLEPGDTIWSLDYMPEIYLFSGALTPTRHQENFLVVTTALNPDYGLWYDSETNTELIENRKRLMEELRESPPRFILRHAQRCKAPFEDWKLQVGQWPENIYGDPMASCHERMPTFEELDAFIAARYRLIVPPVVQPIDVYERVLGGP